MYDTLKSSNFPHANTQTLLYLNAISSYGNNLFVSINQCDCKPHAIYISLAGEWATMLQFEIKLHDFNKLLTNKYTHFM